MTTNEKVCFAHSRDFIKCQEAHFFRAGCVLRSKKTHLASVRIYARSASNSYLKYLFNRPWKALP